MRVLHVAPSLSRAYGGPTRSLVGFVRAGRAAGVDVEVVGPTAPEAEEAWLRGQLPGVTVATFPARGRGAFVMSPAMDAWLRANVERYDAVHVHGLWNPVSSLAARVCVRRRKPVVIRPFGTLSRYTFQHRRTLIKRVYRRLLDGPNLRRAAALHFTTATERDEAAWHGIDFTGRSWIVPPPLHLEAGADADAPADPQATAHDGPTLVCVCRVDPVKNLELLLDAWNAASGSVRGARLVIAGDGDPAYLRTLKERAGAGVRFAGFVGGGEKAALLAGARAFVLPSRHENFGIAVLEAIGAGLPVVITPEVQLAPWVAEHGLGRVVPAQVDAWASVIERLLASAGPCPDERARAARLARESFSEPAVGARLMEMYRSVADQPA